MKRNTFLGSVRRRMALGLGCLLPFMMGGCPEFRDDIVSVFEVATQSALFGTEDREAIAQNARVSLADAAISLLYDQLRSDSSR